MKPSHIPALGQTGPLSHKFGYDYNAQIYAGFSSTIAEASEAPQIPLPCIESVSTDAQVSLPPVRPYPITLGATYRHSHTRLLLMYPS